MNKLRPDLIDQIDHEIENSILSLLVKIVQDEAEYKITIGKMFIKEIAGERISKYIQYVIYKAKQEFSIIDSDNI